MHDMQRSAGDGGRSDDLADRLDRGTGLDAARTAYVRVDRQASLGGETEHVNHLQPGRSGRVLDAHANCQAAGVKLGAQLFPHDFDLFRCGGLIGRGSALGQDFRDAGMGLAR